MKRSAVLHAIKSSFAELSSPAFEDFFDGSTVQSQVDDVADFAKYLSGRNWRELVRENFDRVPGDRAEILGLIAPRASVCFLPAFLVLALCEDRNPALSGWDYTTMILNRIEVTRWNFGFPVVVSAQTKLQQIGAKRLAHNLTEAQRSAVAKFLLFVKNNANDEGEKDRAAAAYADFWQAYI
jgi:hypothetical protein